MFAQSRRAGCVAVLTLLATTQSLASEEGQWIADRIQAASYQYYLDSVLCTHDGCDRGVGGLSHDPARDNIAGRFARLGLAVDLHAFQYAGSGGWNVVATQSGTVDPGVQYIVGAHYDSADNPGADDDASGVAALLEIARVLSDHEFAYTIKYIAFDMEEWGLIGSDQYVMDHINDDVRGMIQLDMIAFDDGTHAARIYGREASASIKNALTAAILNYSTLGVSTYGTLDGSDHAPFEWAGFPACLAIEEGSWVNPCYHTACDSVDTPNYIDHGYATEFARSVAGFLADHADVILCVGDVDGDAEVDLDDLTLLLVSFGQTGPGLPADVDSDGDVDLDDLTELLQRFGTVCN